MSRQSFVISFLFIALWANILKYGVPTDFLAVYFAGLEYANGNLDLIYPPLQDVFDLSYPPEWDELAAERGLDGEIFPFIYPPIWAAIAGSIVPYFEHETLFAAVYLINGMLFIGCAVLAWRIVRPKMSQALWLFVFLVFCSMTNFGFVALIQGQSQILVTFLILLAIERARSRALVVSGIVLAIAASIKIYPLIFVAIWLARGTTRAVFSFIVMGAMLLAVSVVWTGWSLHQVFLDQLHLISNSHLLTSLTYNLSSAVLLLSSLSGVMTESRHNASASDALIMASRLGLGFSVIALAIASRFVREQTLYTTVWPLMIIAVSFFSPMTWAYHYLTAFAFLPLVFCTANRLIGWVLICPMLIVTNPLFVAKAASPVLSPVLGCIVVLSLALFLIVSAFAAEGPE